MSILKSLTTWHVDVEGLLLLLCCIEDIEPEPDEDDDDVDGVSL